MMRWDILLLVAAVLGGCAAEHPPATAEEKDIVSKNLEVCLFAADGKLDDGRSDASSVALALLGPCEDEFHAFEKVMFQQENLHVRALLAQNATERRLEMATHVVLEVRSAALAKIKKSPKGTSPSGEQL